MSSPGSADDIAVGAQTLAEHLSPHAVDIADLRDGYRPMLDMVRELIGVVPRCDNYLEIWPPGFRTYNLVVANFLNLPGSLLGRGAPKDLVGLAMYASSRVAECAYCSAHTCSFALRRGATPDAITGESRSPAEEAVITMAETLATIATTTPRGFSTPVRQQLGAEDTEWVALSVALMGFLNKFMDAIGVELEIEAVQDVSALIEPTGWSIGQHGWRSDFDIDLTAPAPKADSLGTYGRILRNGPAATRLERSWMRGLPPTDQARDWVEAEYGVDESALACLTHEKPVRALAAVLRQNLDPSASIIGVARKAEAAAVFADVVHSETRRTQSVALARHAGASTLQLDSGSSKVERAKDEAVVALTKAIAPSPAIVTPDTIAAIRSVLAPAEIVEVVVWVSVQQLLHRLDLFLAD